MEHLILSVRCHSCPDILGHPLVHYQTNECFYAVSLGYILSRYKHVIKGSQGWITFNHNELYYYNKINFDFGIEYVTKLALVISCLGHRFSKDACRICANMIAFHHFVKAVITIYSQKWRHQTNTYFLVFLDCAIHLSSALG